MSLEDESVKEKINLQPDHVNKYTVWSVNHANGLIDYCKLVDWNVPTWDDQGMSSNLQPFLKIARDHPNTAIEQEAQRRNFAYGNTHFGNEGITRSTIDKAAEDLKASYAPDGLSA